MEEEDGSLNGLTIRAPNGANKNNRKHYLKKGGSTAQSII